MSLWLRNGGEVLGMVVGTAAGMSSLATVVLAVVLAFIFGYAFTMVPLVRAGPAGEMQTVGF